MGLLGTLLALPVRIVNAPIRAAENFMLPGDVVHEDDRFLSAPLNALGDALEEVDELGEQDRRKR